ncbi:hypothetical protein KGQ27_02050 [Patescibacteria group bacterium]|nr:hypothetical protein [Patescibacteria group bacterium]MDE1946300.1 hypothetical protein [Patescibacteria group bacterium]MDE2010752.1 hypothetical protein [Patescibacteria group bacterium]MDE2232636.1 hypothetical protein [Patescibacteria group bacterium]
MPKEIEIIPAILPQDYDEIADKVSRVSGLTKTVQVDVCDGHFVPSFSWPYKGDHGEFEKLAREEEGLPDWEKINYEFDLMVDRPEEVVDGWVGAGAARIVLHAEAKGDLGKAIEMLNGLVEVGMALNIDTPISAVGDPKFKVKEGSLQFIQLMGIDRVGFQGQEFDARAIDKIKEIKKMCPDYPVSVDGGVSLENARRLIDAGADRLVIGSAIFESGDVMKVMRELRSDLGNHVIN